MGFSFNWAGLNVPQIKTYDSLANVRNDMQNIASGVRGYERKEANNQYADMIRDYSQTRDSSLAEIDSIKAEISRLQARNEQIQAELRA